MGDAMPCLTLQEFIRQNQSEIIDDWVAFARTQIPAADRLNESQLRDHAEEIVDAVLADMKVSQSRGEQTKKSHGLGERRLMKGSGEAHARVRIGAGFRIDQMIAEYRALRASVIRRWEESRGDDPSGDLTRFNESIDEALTEAGNRYNELITQYRDQFLAILGHDLRNPLGAIVAGASLLAGAQDLGPPYVRAAARILKSAWRMNKLVADLLDLAATRLGNSLPVTPVPLRLDEVCRQATEELESFHPEVELRFESSGDLDGLWDRDRLAQVVSNLVGNAIQHGDRKRPIRISTRPDGDWVVLEVHNEGPAIAQSAMRSVFDPMFHGPSADKTSLGLGLYIVREIVAAHGGSIDVSSSEDQGTTFTARLPRHPSEPTAEMYM